MKQDRIPSFRVFSDVDLTSLRRFIQDKVIRTSAEREEKGEFPLHLYEELHRLGWIQAFIPSELGGAGLPTSDLIWVLREIGYGSAGMATSVAANTTAYLPLLAHARPELREEIARDFLARLTFASFCFTEPDTGSDVLRIKTRAKRVPGGYSITGRKCLISNVNYADRFLIVSQMEGADHPKKAFTLFMVPAGTPGLSTGKPYRKMGNGDSNTSEVFLDDVRVPEVYRIGEEGEGLSIALKSLARSRSLFAAAAIGISHRGLDLVREDAGSRMRSGKPLLTHPSVQALLAQLSTEVQGAWYLTCSAASHWDSGDFSLIHSSMAKMFAGQTVVKVTDECLELIGGWGYLKEFEIERLYRDAKLFEIIEGPTLVQQILIAKELFSELGTQSSRLKTAA